jgi:NADPH:quinone reductase-like Zn-dependent oxidoreductase
MRALRFQQTGSLENLKVEDVPTPVPASNEALVQVKAAAINPSDVKNVLGKMHETTVPRVPGRDFAGIVAERPEGWKGKNCLRLRRQSRIWSRRNSSGVRREQWTARRNDRSQIWRTGNRNGPQVRFLYEIVNRAKRRIWRYHYS